MAHAGKRYPVHFRRDFNLNVTTNSVGIAKAYALTSQSGFGVVGQALPGKRFVCITRDETTFPGAIWESESQSVGGRDISILIVCDPAKVNSGIVAMLQMIDSSAGAIGQASIGGINLKSYTNFQVSWDQQFTPRRDLFLPHIGTTGILAAVLWSEWNNL